MVEREFKRIRIDKKIQSPITPAKAGVIGRLLLMLSLVLFSITVPVCAQWKPLITIRNNVVYKIYFLDLPGKPRIGFAIAGDVFKTTDGGSSWRKIPLPPSIAIESGLYDIAFKDSLTGWISVEESYKPDGSGELGGCIKTTDGGETWSSLLPGSTCYAIGVYYNKKSNGLFLSCSGVGGSLGCNLVSWDEGTTWLNQTFINEKTYGRCAFSNDDTGILSSFHFARPPWYRTSDAGQDWTTIAMDTPCYSTLAIPGTETCYANTVFGNILRTDDIWNSWKVIYQFPPMQVPYSGWNQGPNSFFITGDSTNLIVQYGPGVYRSTDGGFNWNFLCGPGWEDIGEVSQCFMKGNEIFCATNDYPLDSFIDVTIWKLNLDSLNIFSTQFSLPNSAKQTSVTAGNKVTVNFSPLTSDPIGIDSGHIVIHFDSSALLLDAFTLPPSWVIVDSSTKNGILDIHITADSNQQLPNPIITLTFNTYLSSPSAKVYLDSAHLYGKRLNCDCQALSIDGPDSVEINFTGCGDSILLAAMEGKPPFSVISIQPNPASNEIAITLSKTSGALNINYQVIDILGATMKSGQLAPIAHDGSDRLDLGGLPSGSYYLRLSSGGFVETRNVILSR